MDINASYEKMLDELVPLLNPGYSKGKDNQGKRMFIDDALGDLFSKFISGNKGEMASFNENLVLDMFALTDSHVNTKDDTNAKQNARQIIIDFLKSLQDSDVSKEPKEKAAALPLASEEKDKTLQAVKMNLSKETARADSEKERANTGDRNIKFLKNQLEKMKKRMISKIEVNSPINSESLKLFLKSINSSSEKDNSGSESGTESDDDSERPVSPTSSQSSLSSLSSLSNNSVSSASTFTKYSNAAKDK